MVQWLRDGLGIIRSSAEVEALAASVPDNGGVYLVPAFAGLGAPHWDAVRARHASSASRAAPRPATSRGPRSSRIAFQVADLLRGDAGATPASRSRSCASTAARSRNDLLMQFQADLLGVPVVRPEVTETTALGAAYLAGLAVGFWKSHRRDRRPVAGRPARSSRRCPPPRPPSCARAGTRRVERAKGWERGIDA